MFTQIQKITQARMIVHVHMHAHIYARTNAHMHTHTQILIPGLMFLLGGWPLCCTLWMGMALVVTS